MIARLGLNTLLFVLSCTVGLSVLHAQDPAFDETLQHMRELVLFEDERAEAARSYTKIDEALQVFLETDFMKKYKEIRLDSESLIYTFKAHSVDFTPEEVAKVKKEYTKIADQFNLLLNDIKKDLMDPKKIKYIKNYPDMYSASLELRLRELRDDYAQNFEKSVAEITGNDSYSAIPLAAIISMVKLTVDFTNYLVRAHFESRKIKEEHLNAFLIEPYSFKVWDSID